MSRRGRPDTAEARVERVYRALLRLLPAAFRDRYGDDMAADFVDRWREARGVRGATARLWLRAIGDVVAAAPAEWARDAAQAVPGRHVSFRRSWLGPLPDELRWGFRSLRRAPGVAAVAIVTLALGIGVNTAVFSAVHALLLERLPYRDPDRLVLVWPEQSFNRVMVERIGRASPALEGISGVANWSFTLTGEGGTEEVSGSRVFARHFDVLGVRPALGRGFRAEEGQPGRSGVVVLSHALWQRRFGGDPAVLGRTLRLAGGGDDRLTERTVIGVMGPEHRAIGASLTTPELWVPLLDAGATPLGEDATWYVGHRVARLAKGATLAQAQEQLRAEARRLHAETPDTIEEESARTAELVPLDQARKEEVGEPLALLMAAVALVLLIACANVANLLLARGETRERELAIRRALGGGRLAIARQLLLESAVLGIVGGGLGLALAGVAVRALRRTTFEGLPSFAALELDLPVLAFGLAVSLAAVLVFGVLPAVRGSRQAMATELRQGGRGALGATHGQRLPGSLVATQIALAVVVAVASGLMLRSLHALYGVDPGLRTEGILTFKLSPQPSKYGDPVAFNQVYDRVFERIEAVPGVRGTGAIQLLPLTANNWNFPTYVEGQPVRAGESAPSFNFRVVRPGWFRTMAIPLRAGRQLTATDGLGETPDVALINETLARERWPADPLHGPIGRELHLFSPDGPAMRIVGVVGDVRQLGLDQRVLPEVYVTAQEWEWSVSLWGVVDTGGDPLALAPAIRRAIASVDRELPVTGLAAMEDVFVQSAGRRRVVAALLTSFGLLALGLGAVGVFGVTSHRVAQRLPEMGLRKALGATSGELVGETLRRGLAPVAAGIALGAAGAIASGRLLATQLYGVSPHDPATLIAVVAVLLVTATAANALPALRGGAVDPMRVLRQD